MGFGYLSAAIIALIVLLALKKYAKAVIPAPPMPTRKIFCPFSSLNTASPSIVFIYTMIFDFRRLHKNVIKHLCIKIEKNK